MDHLPTGYGNLKHDLEWRAARLRASIEKYGGPIPLELVDGTKISYEGSLSELTHMDSTVAFFAVATELLDILEKELFEQTFLLPEYRDGTIGDYVGNSRRDVISRFDVLDDELRSKIRETREYRNELIHEPGSTQRTTSVPDLEKRVDTALEAIGELEEVAFPDG